METNTLHEYLLSKTAIRVWETNDSEGENKMLVCVYALCKEQWFKTVIYKFGAIPEYRMQELAEQAFYDTWYRFIEKGKAGRIRFTEAEYTGYVKQGFHRTFIRILKKEIKEKDEKKEFARYNNTVSKNNDNQQEIIQEKLQKTLAMLQPESVLLMKWRYVQKLSYSVIAQKMEILEKSCKQKLFRAKKEFIKNWKINNKGE